MAKIYVSEIKPNQEVASSFIVEEKQLRVARSGAPYLSLKLADRTGLIAGRVWEQAEAISATIVPKSVVSVRGRTELYRDELQLQIFEISPAPMSQVNRSDFLPVSPIGIENLVQKLHDLASSIKRGALKRLMRQLLGDSQLMDRFKIAPAAKSMHHAYLGGLLEHSVAVAELVSNLSAFYQDLNRDLLVAGALLHDIGKIDEYVYDLSIDYSIPGRLLGHMVLGVKILEEKIRSLRSFPTEDALLIEHLILSHHGDTEFGAVRLPMTREALVLHFADDLDAKMNSLTRILADSRSGDEAWSAYQPLFERFFFRGFPIPAGCEMLEGEGTTKRQGVQLHLWSGTDH